MKQCCVGFTIFSILNQNSSTMKKLTFTLMATVMSSIMLFSACSKEGPAGPAGATGAQGPAGATGTAGPAGTANVIYSAWTDVTYIPIDEDEDGTTDFFYSEIEAPKLDLSILGTGEVKVYFNLGTQGDPYIVPLPYSDLILTAFFLNTIELNAGANFSTTTNDAGEKVRQYRYVLIPGGTAARQKAGTVAVDWNNYQVVKDYLQLAD